MDEPDRKTDRIGERECPGSDGAVNVLDVQDRVDQRVRCQAACRQPFFMLHGHPRNEARESQYGSQPSGAAGFSGPDLSPAGAGAVFPSPESIIEVF